MDTAGAGGAGHRGIRGPGPWWLWAGAGETGQASGLRLVRGGVEGPGGLGGELREAPVGWERAPEGVAMWGGPGAQQRGAAQGRSVGLRRGAACGRAGVQRWAAWELGVGPRMGAAWGRAGAGRGAAQGRSVGLRRGAAWGRAMVW